jgi:hypothetical protein
MPRLNQVGSHKTSIFTDIDEMTKVSYHHTAVVSFNEKKIVLDNGGYRTVTTKARMNQASNQFNLGFSVYQKDYKWYVDFKGVTYNYPSEKLTLEY